MTLSAQALQVAITQIGKEENPIGSNWGHPVQDYLASVGIHFPAAWCASFLYWSMEHASGQMGTDNPMYKSGAVLAIWNNDKIHHEISEDMLQPGDIFIMDFGKGLGHCGIIESIDGNILHTIEGNTNNNGSREGIAVERKERSIKDSKIIGYLRYI